MRDANRNAAGRYQRRLHDDEYRLRLNADTRARYASKSGASKRSAQNTVLVKKYGITIDDFDDILAIQDGACAVCSCPEERRNPSGTIKRLVVDHDHDTGKVRGLLCHNCNIALGLIHDDQDVLRAMLGYLGTHS